MVLCFAFAYGLHAIGAPGGLWGAFLWVALTCGVLFLLIGLTVVLIVRRLSKMSKTRRMLADDTSLLRRARSAARTATKVG
jgi:membrane protein implicated in regulation of membrane protease activity